MTAALALAPDHLRTAGLVLPASPAGRRPRASTAGRRSPTSAAAYTGSHQAQRMRLSRRGRVVGAVGAAVIVVAVWSSLVDAASAAAPPRTVTVQSGQTLSEIARRELPELPTREAVVRLQLANALSSSDVHAGQVLQVPVDG